MLQEEYKDLLEQAKNRDSDDLVAGFIVFSLFCMSMFFILLSSLTHGLVWLISQFILGINILQWFFILHDLGHDKYFKNKNTNMIIGLFSSIFVILPFYPWRYIHRAHHLWVGFKDKDPTQNLLTIKDIPEKRYKIINFCWKYWIPIFTLSFSFDNFWNLKKLNTLYPEKKVKNIISIIIPIFFHLFFILSLGPAQYLKTWGLAYFIFLFFCDPLLLSQHSGKKQMIARDQKVSMIHFKDQGEYTRSLKFPSFIEKFILLGFNKHTLHHLLPTIPGYHLIEMDFHDPNTENWLEWLKNAKSLDGVELLYSDKLNFKELLPIQE